MPTNQFPFFSTQEAADECGLTPGRIRKMLLDGDIQGIKVGERAWAIPVAEVEKIRTKPLGRGRPRSG